MNYLRALITLSLLSAMLLGGGAACSTSATDKKDEASAKAASTRADESEQDQNSEPSAPSEPVDSDVIPVGDSPTLGPADAPVTIVEFADYQCPYCAKSNRTMQKLRETYGDDVRIVFKHKPLPFHRQAEAASRAAIAAGNQGKFWEMHDLLFRYQKVMKGKSDEQMKNWAAGFAGEMDLDVDQFRADFDADSTTRRIEDDMALAQELSVRGTPHFLINGQRISGAQPIAKFGDVIDEELEAAEQWDEERDRFYRRRVAANYGDPSKREPRAGRGRPTKIAYVPVEDDDPVRGAIQEPLVTLVAFSDFQCPFCAKAVPTLDQVEKDYGDKVRIVYKQLPLPMHRQAEMAAEIALAAQEQGKFWEMHNLLFERQRDMRGKTDDEMVAWGKSLAEELGLDGDALAKRVRNRAHQDEIKKERELASEVGSRGTPNFWVNGKNLVGAQPYPKFEALIDEQLEIAESLRDDKGLEGEALYKAAVQYNDERTPDVEEPAARKQPPTQVDVSGLTIDPDQVKNPGNYDVTVFAFADYQCPYCKRGHENLERAVGKVNARVRIIFKHYPLPFHKDAESAAIAAMAAGEQDKFWEMSDLLFEHQKRLGEQGLYVELARTLGLNVSTFESDMKSKRAEYKKQIDDDMAQGERVSVRGTPAYFIDGERLVGAQPVEKFIEIIEKKASEPDD